MFPGERTGTRIEVRQLLNGRLVAVVKFGACTIRSRPSAHRLKNRADSKPRCAFLAANTGSKIFQTFPRFSLARSGSSRSVSTTTDSTGYMNFAKFQGSILTGETVRKSGDRLKLPSRSGDDRMEKKVVADESVLEGIGPVTGEFYVYDRVQAVRRRMANIRLLETYLDETGGNRVYWDGIRVYKLGRARGRIGLASIYAA